MVSYLSSLHELRCKSPFAAKRDYLSLLASLLYENGCPIHRLESHLNVVAHLLGLGGSTFVILPGLLIFLLVDEGDRQGPPSLESIETSSSLSDNCGQPDGKESFNPGANIRNCSTSTTFPIFSGSLNNQQPSSTAWWDSSKGSAITHIIKVSRGYNMSRLQDIEDALSDLHSSSHHFTFPQDSERPLLCNRESSTTSAIPLQDDWMRLLQIKRSANPYGYFVKMLSYGAFGATCSPLIFRGSIGDSLASFVIGLVVGGIIELSEKMNSLRCVMEISISLLVGFISRCLALAFPKVFCYWSICLAGIAWVLPGLSLTCSVMEISTGHLVSGTVHMFYSLIVAIMLGFGMSIGTRLVIWAPDPFPPACPGHSQEENIITEPLKLLSTLLLFALCNIFINILLNANRRQIPSMLAISGIGYVIYLVMLHLFTPEAASIVSALVIGLLSVIYRHLTKRMAIAPIMSGIMILVPGSLGVRGVTSFLDRDILSGVKFGFDMIVLAISLSLGLFFSHMLGTPSSSKRAHPSVLF